MDSEESKKRSTYSVIYSIVFFKASLDVHIPCLVTQLHMRIYDGWFDGSYITLSSWLHLHLKILGGGGRGDGVANILLVFVWSAGIHISLDNNGNNVWCKRCTCGGSCQGKKFSRGRIPLSTRLRKGLGLVIFATSHLKLNPVLLDEFSFEEKAYTSNLICNSYLNTKNK